jgi:hypothetical protein
MAGSGMLPAILLREEENLMIEVDNLTRTLGEDLRIWEESLYLVLLMLGHKQEDANVGIPEAHEIRVFEKDLGRIRKR